MSYEESYIEKCIQALPKEKQISARNAFREISEDGGDGPISKLLILMEANGMFIATIPRETEKVLEKGSASLQKMLDSLERIHAQNQHEIRQEVKSEIREQIPVVVREISLDKVVLELEVQNTKLTRLERGISRLRHLRIGGVLLLMALAAVSATGGVIMAYAHDKKDRHYLDQISKYGIVLKTEDIGNSVHVTITGVNLLQGATKADESGKSIGANLVFEKKHE